MPSLSEFARRIRIRGKGVEKKADEVVRKVAVVASQTVVTSTPVDTGHARANWVVGLGSPVRSEQQGEDKSGSATIQRNEASIAARRDQAIYISNNVPYIGRLNEGYSAQAPANFVEKAVQSAVQHVKRSRLVD